MGRDNCMKQSERLLLQVNSFERELTERRNKEVQLKSEMNNLQQEKRNTLEKENETHEKYLLANSKLDKERKLVSEHEQSIERLQSEIKFSAKAREELNATNDALQLRLQENDAAMKKMEKEFGLMKEKLTESIEENKTFRCNSEKMVQELFEARSTVKELGRTHAQIQVAWNTEKSRQWVEDSEVDSCPGCKCEFSLMIRRHHCRKCGG